MRPLFYLLREFVSFSMVGRALLLGAAFLAGVAGLWAGDRSPPVVVLEARAVPDQVLPGDALEVHYVVERFRDCASSSDRYVFDGRKVRYDVGDLENKASPGPMGRDEFFVRVPIPVGASPGPGMYRTALAYRCNPLHAIWPVVTPREVRFTILPPP